MGGLGILLCGMKMAKYVPGMKKEKWMKALLLGAALVALPCVSLAEVTEQYDTLGELIYEHGDYDEGNGTFEMYSDEPLEFRLSKPSIQGEPAEVTYYENWRAAIYGVYNTFAHTPAEALTVTAMPLWFEGFMQRDNSRLMEEHAITLQVSRAEALQALEAASGIDSLAATKELTEYGYQWSPAFLDVYYEDRVPGIDALIQELRQYCLQPCD
jgi:hypothetical protein